jgi:hypothetical protein
MLVPPGPAVRSLRDLRDHDPVAAGPARAQRSVKEQQSLAQPGQPVAAVHRGEPCLIGVVAVLAQVVDHLEAGAVLRVVQADLHGLMRRMLGRVDERLLRGPGDRQPGIGRQWPRRAADLKGHPGAVAALVSRAELGQPVGQRQGVAAQRVHGPAGLAKPVGGHPLRLVQDLDRPRLVMLVGEHGPGGLDVQRQGAQRVREHVVDLARDPGALAQCRHRRLLLPQLVRLGQQHRRLLGPEPVIAPVEAEQQPGEQGGRVPDESPDVRAPGQRERLEPERAQRRHDPADRQAVGAARRYRGDEG